MNANAISRELTDVSVAARMMKRLLLFTLLLLGLSGCGGKIQSDLQIENARFSVDERGKALFSGSVKNTGKETYESVFIVVDAYENDRKELTIETSADLLNGRKLGPGETTSFSKEFEDGGVKPDRHEVVRLYGFK